jgi:hypothetical protein
LNEPTDDAIHHLMRPFATGFSRWVGESIRLYSFSLLQQASRLSALAVERLAVVIHRDGFEPWFEPACGMMLLLVSDVIQHPKDLFLAKANDAEAALPLQAFHAKPFVYLVRARTFEIADEIANAHMRFDVDGDMDMCWRAADAVEVDAIRFAAAII